ncbi:hypothetical protein GGI08_001844 [Coemansia sp. S2]|nr:hypothetical protein GGI08_001844 [Coemansia sp. S2]KAJ2353504.1 hypothetical protein GGH92_000616 [Coemansia sp. RSA 2673]
MTPEQRVSAMFALLANAGKKEYVGGRMLPMDHALRIAKLAKDDGADEETVLAALFFNIGHFVPSVEQRDRIHSLGPSTEKLSSGLRVAGISFGGSPAENTIDHGKIGAEYLRQLGFPNKTCELVESQSSARSYISTIDPTFSRNYETQDPLLTYTVASLLNTGKFENGPYFDPKVKLVKWEVAAAKVDTEPPALDTYRDMAIRNIK